MLFNSAIFALFFIIFLPLFLATRGNVARRNALLILASYVFYGWWDPRFLILVAISTSVDYMAALGAAGKVVRRPDKLKALGFIVAVTLGSLAFASLDDLWLCLPVGVGILIVAGWIAFIERLPQARRRKYWLALSLVTNLGILAFFKYFNFFVGSLHDGLAGLGVDAFDVTLQIILPVGLSFYTFQAISRTIDSYRGHFDPQYSLVNYAAYHAFFPQLVAGPIERAAHLMPQFEEVRPLRFEAIKSGALLFLWGLYQKMVVADNVAPLSDALFTSPVGKDAGATIAGILAFTLQIYCDFCGYSNMARGLARCLGFELVANFNLPYFSRSPSEFWRRWHISLSSWLRDYLYVPLGGNRRGELIQYRNLLITMLLGGLWHGAAWTFVAWGAFHGSILVLYRLTHVDTLLEKHPATRPQGVALHVTSWFVTMVLVMVGWVLFRARSFTDAMTVLTNLFGTEGFTGANFWPLFVYGTPIALAEIYQRFANRGEVLNVGPLLVRYTVALTVLMTLLVFAASSGQEFIYFDF